MVVFYGFEVLSCPYCCEADEYRDETSGEGAGIQVFKKWHAVILAAKS